MVKTKPTKHKEENTFKFKTFAERLSSVNVDVIHRINLKRNAIPDETETFFYEALEKWADLNCTEGFTVFCRRLGRDIQSLGQLLLHEEKVISLLLEHIDKENQLFLEPILELVVAVAKDLQSDFYPKFPEFFLKLVGLLQVRDPEITEWTFTTLAYLYKNLWRLLVKDIDNVYGLLLPLLASTQPDHVQQFATESFAFIGRKVGDHTSFVELIFRKLRENAGDSQGVGQLLFQIVKGVKNQFHTSLEIFLPIYFQSISCIKENVSDDPVFNAVNLCFILMARHTSQLHCARVWNLLLEAIKSSNRPGILGLLLLFQLWVEFKEGELVTDSLTVSKTLASLLNEEGLDEEEQKSVSATVAALMQSAKVRLPIEQTSKLGQLAYTYHWKPDTVLDFTLQVSSHGFFESHVLPHYISYCHGLWKKDQGTRSLMLKNLASLISTKGSLPKSGYDMSNFKIYPLEFTFAMRKSSDAESVPDFVQSILESKVETMVNEDFQTYINAIVCLPNLRPIDSGTATRILTKIIKEVANIVEVNPEEPQTKRAKITCPVDYSERLGLVLSLAILGVRHFSSDLEKDVPWAMIRSAFLNDTMSTSIFYLRAADFYLTSLYEMDNQNTLSLEVFCQIYDVIGQNLGSPYHEVRLLTLHILSLFSPPMPAPPENVNPTPIFQTCLNAELIPAGVREQREKLVHLQNLEAERVIYSLPVGGHFAKAPLQYLLSQLYINFRPLWEPVLKLIESHAFSMESSKFWSVYLPFLESVRQCQAEEIRDPSAEMEYLNLTVAVERIDFTNTRSLAWSGLSRIGSVTEKEHSIIVPLFLNFWNTEYCVNDGNIAQTQNLNTDVKVESTKGERGNIIKLLSSYLSVLASFQQPQKMTREPEVTKILLRLLSHRFGDIQKQALDCLMAYGYPFLTPYKENLYRLLDDKSFRTEITSFSIDTLSSSIKLEHRAGLTSILIRILYGKMMFKAGSGSSGKDNIQFRQAVILRYIAGLADSEIDVFLDLAFQLFSDFTKTEGVDQHVVRMMREADPKLALPLKRIQGALVLMGTIFSKLGNIMKSTLPKLLHMLLNISAHVMGLLGKRNEVDPKHIGQLKNLRTIGWQRITQFFKKFERYPWTPEEIEAVFHVYIWPQLEMLSDQAYSGPTPMLRLFQVWSENSRYFVLFGKAHPDRPELAVLQPLLALLSSGKAVTSVCAFVMDIVDKLVTTADYGTIGEDDDDEKEEPIYIKPNFSVEWDWSKDAMLVDDVGSESRVNYGSTLLIPHLSSVLTYLRKFITHGLNGRDLNVLMRVSEYVKEAQLSTELARMIIPAIKVAVFRNRKSSNLEEKLIHYLSTLANLVQSAVSPHEFISPLATLFGTIEGRNVRQGLCRVLEVICEQDPSQGPLGQLVSSMNKWDPQRLEEPDYTHRLQTHKEINLTLESGTPSFEWTALALYNSFNFVRTENDSSLRDNASLTLQIMTAAFNRLKYGKTMLNEHFIPQLRLLVRSSIETVRHEGISILSKAVSNCSAMNASLNSLRKLRKEGDVEVDFFENCRHLQTHRRSRALLRLTGVLKADKTSINGETITQYLLPLATCYLFNEEYAKHNHLIDAALESLQAIARCLSWHNYEKLLRFYLSNMTRQVEYQKQAVKAVVAILNAFHFDLKNSKFKSYYAAKAIAAKTAETKADVPVVPDIQETLEESSIAAPAEDSATPAADLEITDQQEPNTELPEMAPEEEEIPLLDGTMATKIHSVIAQQLLPELNAILTARTNRDKQHKAVKDHYPEDEEILRVPIALALVNLLKNLPPGTLERSLPGMFSKVCTFLKSRCNSVRETARNTLIEMVISLGPEHLSALMEAANPLLQRGYQVHVYIFTMHALLAKLGEIGQLKHGSLDGVVYPLVELCKKELYGDTADEKEVEKIVNKLKEAKGIKAFNTLQIVAKHVSQSYLLRLVVPFKDILASTKSFKMTRKVEECLHNVALGLAANSGLSIAPLLIFVHGVISLSIPELRIPVPRVQEDPNVTASGRPLRTDSLILAPVPKRKVAAAALPSVTGASKSAYIINSHIVVEFGLLIFSLILKREKCHENASTSVIPMLDPILPIIYNNLTDPHSKLVALSLRCICTLLRVPLPSITEYATKISTAVFSLLHKYSGSTAGENLEMVQTAFKAISILVRHVTNHAIDTEQLRVLLVYSEQALFDPKQQSIAFGVLKAIVKRKLTLEELPGVMMRVAELSIKAEAVPVRVQSRKVVLQYMVDYPLGKKLLRYVQFFLKQLDYDKESGRLSAIEFLVSLFNTFPKNFLSQQSTLFLVTMSPYLINETSASCVKAMAAAIRILIERLNTPTATTLFEMCLTWLRGNNTSHKRLAVQLCGIFVAAEKSTFEFRLKELLPDIVKLLDQTHSDSDGREDREADLMLIQTFYTIIKMTQHCATGLQSEDNIDVAEQMWGKIIHHLVHPHLWIRTLSSRLVGILLGWHKPDELATYITSPTEKVTRSYLLCGEISKRLRSLARDLVIQLQSDLLDNQLADQVIKNLVFIGKVANRIPADDAEADTKIKAPSLPWLTGKLRREINAEVVLHPTTPTKRLAVFKWMAAVAVDLNQVAGKEGLANVLKFFVSPLTRDINDDGSPKEVKDLAQEVSELIKGLVGTEVYSEAVVAANRILAVRRRDRQAIRKADSVTRPEKAPNYALKSISPRG
ncbi:Small subunit processome component 20 [Daphnia magna]|uniref:Small subunit processome component 20 n=1 Tax=Daphnia magna TaxID=35525 RepID=A0A164QU50_9CRUS|nr:Small subunit processome component 20 [Daphnia magna]